MTTAAYQRLPTNYGSCDFTERLTSEQVAERTSSTVIKKKAQISSVSDVYAAAVKANADLRKLPALETALKYFPLDQIKPQAGKPLSHLNMITSWELILVAAKTKNSPIIQTKAKELLDIVVSTFSSSSAYNRQRDADIEAHAQPDCRGCRFEAIR